MNWIFRIIGSLFVVLVLLFMLEYTGIGVEPSKAKAVKPVATEDDSSMKGMKIN